MSPGAGQENGGLLELEAEEDLTDISTVGLEIKRNNEETGEKERNKRG